jgi:acetyl esterase/lipase
VELKRTLGLSKVMQVPPGVQPADYAFGVPRRERLDMRFATTDGVAAALQSLDLYTPISDATKHPIIIWIHGGGMKAGANAQQGITNLNPDVFLARGFAFASLNDRLAPAHRHPAACEGVAAAVAWLHDHAKEFGLSGVQGALWGPFWRLPSSGHDARTNSPAKGSAG